MVWKKLYYYHGNSIIDKRKNQFYPPTNDMAAYVWYLGVVAAIALPG